MTIKELEEASGMTRANIRFYEVEGFLTPMRKANGYREYSEKDLELLLKIKLLRGLSVSLDQIRALQTGEARLDEVLQKKIDELQQEQRMLQNMQTVCRTMRNEQAAFGNLQAEKYLEQLHRLAKEEGLEDTWPVASRIYAPYRRQLARLMDCVFVELFCAMILVFVFHCRLLQMEVVGWFSLGIVSVLAAIILEPYFLHWFTTTPGKAVFGMRIYKTDGTHLTVQEGRERLWEMFITQLHRSARGFALEGTRAARENYEYYGAYWYGDGVVDLPWEKFNHSYTIAENTWGRFGIYLAVLGISVLLHLCSDLPLRPDFYQGEITQQEYAANVNAFLEYYLPDSIYENWTFGANGIWEEAQEYGTAIIYVTDVEPANCTFVRTPQGELTQVAFHLSKDKRDGWLGDYTTLQTAIAGGLLCASEKVGTFSGLPKKLMELIDEHALTDYCITFENIEISCDVEYYGYWVNDGILILNSELENKAYFKMDFTVRKLGKK